MGLQAVAIVWQSLVCCRGRFVPCALLSVRVSVVQVFIRYWRDDNVDKFQYHPSIMDHLSNAECLYVGFLGVSR